MRLARNPTYDVGAVTVVDQAYAEPPVWSDLDLVSGARSERAPPGGAGTRSRAVPHLPARRALRRRGVRPGDRGPAPGHPAGRHRAAAALRLRRLRGHRRAGVGPGPAEPAGPRRGLRRTRTCAAAARAAGAGGSTAGSSTSSTRSPTSSPSPTRWRSGTSTAPGSSPAGSRAGGLLQGAVFSQRPDRWRAVVAEVPFVDVVTTMFDATVPLTINEWDEWGDPRRRADFDWMLAYSPYDNPPPAGHAPRPPRDRRRPRPAGDGARARQVGGQAARDGPGVVAALPVPGARRAPGRTPARPAGSATSPTRPRSTPGSWIGWASVDDPAAARGARGRAGPDPVRHQQRPRGRRSAGRRATRPARRRTSRDLLTGAGIDCELVARDPRRANLVARIPGSDPSAPSLAFVGHLDVVPADPRDWTHPPFAAVVDEGGWLWGRGAIDMKNEVAARAVAMAELARSGFRPRGDLWFIAVADEEDGTADVGMRWLLEARPDIRPDLAINEGGGERLPLPDGRVVQTVEHRREGHLPGPGGRGRRGGPRVHAGRGRQRGPPAGRAAAPGRPRHARHTPSALVDRTLEVLLGEPVTDFATAVARAARLHPVLAHTLPALGGHDDGADPADRLRQAQRDARPGRLRARLPDPAGHQRGRRRA